MTPLSWLGIARLGLVQASLGAIVMLATSLLNRVMIVEYAMAAVVPAALVGWHYAVQLGRPKWGHGSDTGARRTPWIVGGMGVLALGALLATDATLLSREWPVAATAAQILAYTMIGAGVGAAGTSLLALLAARTAPERRPAAAATTWIMMVAGIVITARLAGSALEPYSPERLAMVAGAVALAAFLVALVAVWGVEGRAPAAAEPVRAPFRQVLGEVWAEPLARRFGYFVALSMLAYAMQDLILEPFAGLVFGMTPGQSTSLAGTQHAGVLAGMVLVGAGGRAARVHLGITIKGWIIGGCCGSAAALLALAAAAQAGPGWPLAPTVFALGLANGMFAVAAIGSMMELAGGGGREGTRMGVWGAAQALAFGLGGFSGAALLDLGRAQLSTPDAFVAVFALEAALFLAAAALAARLGRTANPYPNAIGAPA